jgi:serine/threonine-protein kinase
MGKKFCFAILLLFAVTLTVGDSLFDFFGTQGETVTVPHLVGQGADSLLLPPWAEQEISYRYDAAPAGTVIDQQPTAGSVIKIPKNGRRRVTLTVSMGVKKEAIPSVIGMETRAASARLRALGFAVEIQTVAGQQADRVISVTPSEGSVAAIGETVLLTVTAGESAQAVTVPSLTGLSRATALMELFRCGLRVETVTEEDSNHPSGTVIRQSPTAGSLVAPDTPIKLTVSNGALLEESEEMKTPS